MDLIAKSNFMKTMRNKVAMQSLLYYHLSKYFYEIMTCNNSICNGCELFSKDHS